MLQQATAQQQNAKHLAARAVMAYRAGFPIERLSVATKDASEPGIVCDWRSLRSGYGDDNKLLRRGFAFIYIGTIIDQELEEPASEELRKEVSADQSSALEARQIAVTWGLIRVVTETDPFAHGGYKLASRLLRKDRLLVDAFAQHLCEVETMSSDRVQAWFEQHAAFLDLDELERSVTF